MNIVDIKKAIQLLTSGAVGVLPTDTLYGLVALASDPAAVARLYALKNREHKPGTVIAANTTQLITLGLSAENLDKVAYLWPNPLSIVITVHGLDYLHSGLNELAVRVVADEDSNNVLLQTGPLMTSSANLPGEPVATTVVQAYAYFKDSVDFYVDIGDLSEREPSTIIGFPNDVLTIFREGALPIATIENLRTAQS